MDWQELSTELMRFLQASEIEVPTGLQHHYDILLGSLTDRVVPEGATLISLTQGQVTLVDLEDLPRLQQHKWFAVKSGAGMRSETYYCRAKIDAKAVSIHRFLMGITDPDLVVDHRNHDTLDNRKNNLRVVNRTQSAQNRRGWYNKGHGIPFKGVYRVPHGKTKPFRSAIKKDKVLYELGYFETAEEAARAYDARAIELHGEFAALNFPSERIQ